MEMLFDIEALADGADCIAPRTVASVTGLAFNSTVPLILSSSQKLFP
jgi:hypothetical protein